MPLLYFRQTRCSAVSSLFGQTAYHSVRDSYQFTAELRKLLRSLPPRAALEACQALRNDTNAMARSVRREVEGDSDDDELPYMTQVRALTKCVFVSCLKMGS